MSTKNKASEDYGLFTDKLKDPEPGPAATDKPQPPAATAAAPAPAVDSKPAPAANEPKEKVVVIDDSPTILAVVSGILKKAGFATVAFRDPNAAMVAIKKMTPEELKDLKAIFSDLDMPNMTGLEVLKEIREFEPTKSTPFVMITAQTDRSHIQRAALLKVNGYLLKPVTTDTMIEMVGTLFPERASLSFKRMAKAK